MNQAIAQGLSFGDDIVFTFGPYASVYTQLYHPATVRLMVVADGSKIGQATVAKVADASAIDILVTDASADPHELSELTDLGVTVHVARTR